MRSVTRTLSFFHQWMAEVVRQPWLMVSLVLGPFVILVLFGNGETVGAPRPRTIIVGNESRSNSTLQIGSQELRSYLDVTGTTQDLDAAKQSLIQGQADLVVVLPPNPLADLQAGRHSSVQILTNEIDPIKKSYEDTYIREQVSLLNQKAIEKTLSDAQASSKQLGSFSSTAENYISQLQAAQNDLQRYQSEVHQLRQFVDSNDQSLQRAAAALATAQGFFAIPGAQQLSDLSQSISRLKTDVDNLDDQLTASTSSLPPASQISAIKDNIGQLQAAASALGSVPPDVLSAPFDAKLTNVAPFIPTAVGFYTPAVVVLLLQHLGVTLGALSMTRIRLLGLMETIQTSPVKPAEITVGHYLSYGLLSAVVAGILVALSVLALGVPVFGSAALMAAILVTLILTSLGIGFIVSLLSSSEQQAVQIAMLVLIGSIFFSGFLVALNTIVWPIRIVSYALPATYAIRALEDVMLRGLLRTPYDVYVLAAAAVAFFAFTVLLFRREFKAR